MTVLLGGKELRKERIRTFVIEASLGVILSHYAQIRIFRSTKGQTIVLRPQTSPGDPVHKSVLSALLKREHEHSDRERNGATLRLTAT